MMIITRCQSKDYMNCSLPESLQACPWMPTKKGTATLNSQMYNVLKEWVTMVPIFSYA